MGTVRLEHISKSFGKLKALEDINLEIKEGTFCVVLGPSGCGKSTLLNLIAGLEEPTDGKIFFGDKDITDTAPHKRNIAMVFQNYALYPHLTVYENIAFGLRIKKEAKDKIKKKIKETSRILNIEDKLYNMPRQLSGGERQRVATARAIVRNPVLFLFDEPLSNLDARLRVTLREEFIKLHRQLKKTIIYVTHDQIEAMVLGEAVVVIKDGQIQQVSSPQGLYHDPQNLFVAEFIGTPPMNIVPFKVHKFNQEIKLTRDEFKLKIVPDLQRLLENYIDQDIYFGFRPQAARLLANGHIKGELIFTETLGEDHFARLKVCPKVEITVKVQQKLNPQDLVAISVDSTKTYLFDSKGIRIKL